MNISIVTINLNRSDDLVRTLESLHRQTDPVFQLVVIDGGSTDGSQHVQEKFKDLIDVFISEADNGIYDAWNKGINLADGDVVALLNAGDEFHPSVVAEVRKFYEPSWPKNSEVVLTGTTYLVSGGNIRKAIGNKIRSRLLLGIGFAHPAMIVPRNVYRRIGYYEAVTIASDSRFILRCRREGVAFSSAKFSVYMDASGISQRAAVKGFCQYVDALCELGFCGPFVGQMLRTAYRIYRPVANVGLVSWMVSLAANFHHFSIWLMNLVLRLCFFRPLRQIALRMVGVDIHPTSFISPKVTFYKRGNVFVGRGSVVNRDVVLDNRDSISIGSGCTLSYDVRVVTAGHEVDSPYFEYFTRPILIEDHVCVFAGVTVLPGAILRRGVVVLPGSVISGDTIENGIYGGMPARLVRMRASIPMHMFDYHRPFAL